MWMWCVCAALRLCAAAPQIANTGSWERVELSGGQPAKAFRYRNTTSVGAHTKLRRAEAMTRCGYDALRL